MGNVMAAGPSGVPSPPLVIPPPPPTGPAPGSSQGQSPDSGPAKPPEDSGIPDMGPGTFEELHKKCKDLFPMPFEGAKLIINKGLSNHFQINHNLTMSSLQPSGYKFGCTYVGTKQYNPVEAFPILMGDVDPGGNLNANIIHQLTSSLRGKFVAQIQGSRWLATQITGEYRGSDCTAAFTVGNPDIVNDSAVIVTQYLQNVTKNLVLGAELLYQCGPNVPGSEIAIYTIAGRYSGDNWSLSTNFTPMAGGLHVCCYQKPMENVQVGVELEGSLRTQECTATVAYQLDQPSANLLFRGQLDSNFCVGAVLEKKLPPLPFTFALSGFANHVKNTYRFGVGLIVG